jgi:hypothetical protein
VQCGFDRRLTVPTAVFTGVSSGPASALARSFFYRDREGRNMASYKNTPLTHRQFRVEVDEGQDNLIVTGPFNTEAAARAYIEEHSRMARADNRWARTTARKIA